MNATTTASVPYLNVWSADKADELKRRPGGPTNAVVDRDGRIVGKGTLQACFWHARYDADLTASALSWALLGHAKRDGQAAAIAAWEAAPLVTNPYG